MAESITSTSKYIKRITFSLFINPFIRFIRSKNIALIPTNSNNRKGQYVIYKVNGIRMTLRLINAYRDA